MKPSQEYLSTEISPINVDTKNNIHRERLIQDWFY